MPLATHGFEEAIDLADHIVVLSPRPARHQREIWGLFKYGATVTGDAGTWNADT